jgi:hypothetical protein
MRISLPAKQPEVIELRDGINYINKTILHGTAEDEEALDNEFKGLVDSVLKR